MITEWKVKLSTVRAVLEVWLEVQRSWCSLESIFLGSEDIQLLAEYEATDFPVEQDEEAGESASSPAAHTPSIAASLVDAAEDKVEISAAARDAGAPPSMPTGAHRVPPAFRHLLQESVERSEG